MGALLKADVVKEHAYGRCLEIIRALAPQLSHACEKPGDGVNCPCHGTIDGFRLFKDANETGGGICQLTGTFADIFALLQWVNGWTFREAFNAVASHLGLNNGSIAPAMPVKSKLKAKPPKNWESTRQWLMKIFKESTADTGRIAEYFDFRELSIPVPSCLRIHPKLYYHHEVPEGTPKTYYPAMIAQMQLHGKCIGLHITYLDPDGPGKAPCSTPRKIQRCDEHKYNGAALQLFDAIPGEPLIVGEGPETCLAAHELTGLPAWAALNSGLLKMVDLPVTSGPIYILADLDPIKRKGRLPTGEGAAVELTKRLQAEGREVYTAYPPGELNDECDSIDWMDHLKKIRKDAQNEQAVPY